MALSLNPISGSATGTAARPLIFLGIRRTALHASYSPEMHRNLLTRLWHRTLVLPMHRYIAELYVSQRERHGGQRMRTESLRPAPSRACDHSPSEIARVNDVSAPINSADARLGFSDIAREIALK